MLADASYGHRMMHLPRLLCTVLHFRQKLLPTTRGKRGRVKVTTRPPEGVENNMYTNSSDVAASPRDLNCMWPRAMLAPY
jgi:hypothetical protein